MLDLGLRYSEGEVMRTAAMQFYKEQKLWSAKLDEAQKKLLALNP